jgi:RNA polymerase sigma-70 factor (ECF subfamily)
VETKVHRGEFDTTRWSVVLRARDGRAEDALAELCRRYWPPLYAFALRRGNPPEAAQDLTQGFFVRLLEGRYVENVREGRGRFRSFLLGCFEHYLAHEHRKGQAAKRGGGAPHLSLDFDRPIDLPSAELTPEEAYERQWALTLLDGVVTDLERRYRALGRQRLFAALKPLLSVAEGSYDPQRVAAELGMSPGAVKVAAHRLRRQYRDALRRRVAETLDPGESVGGELDFLLSVL